MFGKFCSQKLFWPFTVWINCSSDLKHFAKSRPSALNFKSFSQSLEKIFLTVGQSNFGNKIPFTIIDEYAYHIADCGIHRILTHILLTISEMVIFKILYMYKFSTIVVLDEYFFTNLVTYLNGVINVGLAIIRISLGEQRRTILYFQNFAKPNEFYNKLTWS